MCRPPLGPEDRMTPTGYVWLLLADFPCGLIVAPRALPAVWFRSTCAAPRWPIPPVLRLVRVGSCGVSRGPSCAVLCITLWGPVRLLWVVLCRPVLRPVGSCGRPVLRPVVSCGRSCVHTAPSCGALWGGDPCDWPVEGPNFACGASCVLFVPRGPPPRDVALWWHPVARVWSPWGTGRPVVGPVDGGGGPVEPCARGPGFLRYLAGGG